MSATDNESLAEGFAAEGREELLKRFRDAYAKAAGAHSDYVSLDADKLESMVQRSVSEADGLQWRRALAGVAARELGIDLGSALTHPAVVRAHQLAGAPSYEKALSELAVPVPPAPVAPVPEPPAPPVVPPPVVPEPEAPAVAEGPRLTQTFEPVDAPEVADVPAVETEPELAEEGLAEEEALAVEEPLAVAEAPASEELAPVEELPPVEDAVPVESEAPEPAAAAPAGADAEPVPPEPEPLLPVEAVAPSVPGVDEPTMAYEIPVPSDDPMAAEADAEEIEELSHGAETEFEPADAADEFEVGVVPADETLAHRADEFAEEFLTDDASEDPAESEFTYEHDALPAAAANGVAADEDAAEFSAVHLGGVASLPSSEEIALRLSGEGLDLMQEDGAIVGRLGWEDISALEVTVPHGRRRRRGSPRLVVHTAGGSARFEVPALSGEELQDRLQPLMARYGH